MRWIQCEPTSFYCFWLLQSEPVSLLWMQCEPTSFYCFWLLQSEPVSLRWMKCEPTSFYCYWLLQSNQMNYGAIIYVLHAICKDFQIKEFTISTLTINLICIFSKVFYSDSRIWYSGKRTFLERNLYREKVSDSNRIVILCTFYW